MKKQLIKLLSCVLIACMLLTVFAACDDIQDTQEPNKNENTENNAQAPSSGNNNGTPSSGDGGNQTPTLQETSVSEFEFDKVSDGYAITKFIGTSTKIVIPSKYNGEPVTVIDSMVFYGCSEITSVTIPESVTYVDSTAFGQTNVIQKENGVSYVDRWAIACEETAANVTLRADTVGIASWTFSACSVLNSITIPDSVRNIGDDVFAHCVGLTSITIPNGVKSIGSNAFFECTNLAKITLPNSLTSIGEDAFYNCKALKSIVLPEGLVHIEKDTFEGSGLTSIIIPSSVTSISEYAFSCDGLISVEFKDTDNWYRTLNYEDWVNKTNGIGITLYDTSKNAEFLSGKYRDYYWYKK